MNNIVLFVANSVLLGVGLAMDAFSVSVANAMAEPDMKQKRKLMIAGCFSFFQFLMPLLGWIFVHTIAEYFEQFRKLIPWIALILLCYIGGKLLIEGIREQKSPSEEKNPLRKRELLIQGIATSIDALSVGFAIADYTALMAFTASVIIAVVTFFICEAGLKIGRVFGLKLAGRASVFGGIILILIGVEIFIKGVFGL